MRHLVLFDFGSTFTKAVVVDARDRIVLFTTKVASTVSTDATICLEQCLAEIRELIGPAGLAAATKLASSSAAGGLRMAVCGLTTSLSVTAGRNVSFGAGAKIVHVTEGELQDADLARIASERAEIVLLCGGYEGGNEDTLRHNARMLASSALACPTIFAGNSRVASEFKQLMRAGGREFYVVANVMPQVGVFTAGQAESTVRSLFMHRIVDMKGLGAVRAKLADVVMPTPAAVLSAGELLAMGTERNPGLGELIIADIGGATTDIHSYAPHQVLAGARGLGAREPYAKRTVEGDLGMRESSDTLCREVGYQAVADAAGLPLDQVRNAVARRVRQVDYVPDSEPERRLDQAIAQSAAQLAARRHAGRIERVVSANCRRLQRGKNLRGVATVLGTGGVVVNSSDPAAVLRRVLADASAEPDVLLPPNAALYIDADYVLFAAGLLRDLDEDLAFEVLTNSLRGL